MKVDDSRPRAWALLVKCVRCLAIPQERKRSNRSRFLLYLIVKYYLIIRAMKTIKSISPLMKIRENKRKPSSHQT